MLGTVFAVIIAKQLYGGLGQNPFNPAMIGYVVLLISFPVQMTSWLPPHGIAVNIPGFIDAIQVIFSGHTASGGDMNTLRLGIDGISQATPLDTFKTSGFVPVIRLNRLCNIRSTAVFWRALVGNG